ncbi:MAG TPA: hypothetical protein VHF47_00305 [Acidimicrobiales bacterium]|nr:hypothetical protein [Acidimicrobiales bacterium]
MRAERGAERGSALALVPAGVLVLVVLGALAVDAALAFLGQRALTDAAAAAANDAAAVGMSDAAFYGEATGPIVLDPVAARRAAVTAVAARGLRGVHVTRHVVEVQGDQVCVRLTGRVPYLFSPLVPGVPRAAHVHGRAVATAARGSAPVRSASIVC